MKEITQSEMQITTKSFLIASSIKFFTNLYTPEGNPLKSSAHFRPHQWAGIKSALANK
jgi:hypothetical protein